MYNLKTQNKKRDMVELHKTIPNCLCSHGFLSHKFWINTQLSVFWTDGLCTKCGCKIYRKKKVVIG